MKINIKTPYITSDLQLARLCFIIIGSFFLGLEFGLKVAVGTFFIGIGIFPADGEEK